MNSFEDQVEFLYERATFSDKYYIRANRRGDELAIGVRPFIGSIHLMQYWKEPFYRVNDIHGHERGASAVLYFAALLAAQEKGKPSLNGKVGAGWALTADSARARRRFQRLYRHYIERFPHPGVGKIRVGETRLATEDEAAIWRLKKEPPFSFEFVEKFPNDIV